jgi:hypothetical protein
MKAELKADSKTESCWPGGNKGWPRRNSSQDEGQLRRIKNQSR